MTDVTIDDGKSTPLLHGGQSDTAPSMNNKYVSSVIVRALMMGTAAVGVLLLMLTGPSKMMMRTNSSRNVDTMVVVSSAATQEKKGYYRIDVTDCAPATGTFSGLSCKDSDGWCAGTGEAFGKHSAMNDYETCYVSNNDPPNDRCWSRSNTVDVCTLYGVFDALCDTSNCETCYVSNNDPPNDRCWSRSDTVEDCPGCYYFCHEEYERCDPVGYFDNDRGYKNDDETPDGYNKYGVWHVSAPLSDGSCGNPCKEFKHDVINPGDDDDYDDDDDDEDDEEEEEDDDDDDDDDE